MLKLKEYLKSVSSFQMISSVTHVCTECNLTSMLDTGFSDLNYPAIKVNFFTWKNKREKWQNSVWNGKEIVYECQRVRMQNLCTFHIHISGLLFAHFNECARIAHIFIIRVKFDSHAHCAYLWRNSYLERVVSLRALAYVYSIIRCHLLSQKCWHKYIFKIIWKFNWIERMHFIWFIRHIIQFIQLFILTIHTRQPIDIFHLYANPKCRWFSRFLWLRSI